MSKESVVTSGGKFAYERLHFSEAIKSGDVIYCSGVLGTDEKGRVPEDLATEFRFAWQKILSVLAEAGANADDIVEYTSFHIGLSEHIGLFSQIRDEFVNEPWPAWTAIGTTELAVPGAHVEIKVTAKIGD